MAVSTFLSNTPSRYESFETRKLTNSGDILEAAISPDGQYVAYATRVSKGGNLYLKHIPSASTTKLLQADDASFETYANLTFSPDGNYLYFPYKYNLCRLARLGGEPRVILRREFFDFAISPDGKRLAFWRRPELVTTNEDGSDEKKIGPDSTEKYIYRRIPKGCPWSPDGRLIALRCSSKDKGDGLIIHNLIDSTENDILNPLWSYIDNVAWAADGKSLLLTGKKSDGEKSQIWNISYPQGKVRQVTSDANGFNDLSASVDGKSLLAIQSTYENSLWVLPSGDEFKIQKVPTGEQEVQSWMGWTADNRILFVTSTSRETNLRAVYPDGSKPATLYSDTIGLPKPIVLLKKTSKGVHDYRLILPPAQISRDRQTFYFYSIKDSGSNIWKVDLQSGSRQSIYHKAIIGMALSADGERLYITNYKELLKVRNDGKEIDTIFAEPDYDYLELSLSPDGNRLACSRGNEKLEQYETAIVDVKTGKVLQTLPVSSAVKWTSDGRGVCFIDGTNGVPNLWMQSLAGGKPKQITHFPSDKIMDFAWSTDGHYLAVVRQSNPSDLYLLTVKK